MSTGNLKYQFARLSITDKLIAVNVAIYIVNSLATFLFGMHPNAILQWFELPKDFFDFIGFRNTRFPLDAGARVCESAS